MVTTTVPSLPNIGLICLVPWRPGITGGVQLVKPRILTPIRRRMIIFMILILTVSQYLGFPAINASLTPETVNNRRLISIASPRYIVSYAIRQGIPSIGTSLNIVISAINFIMPIPRRTWMVVYPRIILI